MSQTLENATRDNPTFRAAPEVAARLSAEDLDDIAAGDIPLGTVEGFEAKDLREHFEERAGIFEHDVGLPRPEAGSRRPRSC